MTNMIKRTFPKQIEFRADLPRDLWLVLADATQLYQMVMNLCVNARDAMPGGGRLSLTARNTTVAQAEAVRLHPDARAGHYVVIRVADTGTGIPAEVLDKIFDPFFTTKEFGKGTGLGLSTVMGIAKGHGGFLLVHSTLGAGTEFTIYLPAVEAEQNKLGDGASFPAPTGHGETVLVVDDEAAICRMAQKSLESHGYKVLTAHNGMEAVNLFTSNPGAIKIVLTDMMMPGMDGTATVKAIRKPDPAVRVVGASGMGGIRDAAENAGASFDGFLTKPFRVDELLRTLNQVLRH